VNVPLKNGLANYAREWLVDFCVSFVRANLVSFHRQWHRYKSLSLRGFYGGRKVCRVKLYSAIVRAVVAFDAVDVCGASVD
jgi:hypothetical protein